MHLLLLPTQCGPPWAAPCFPSAKLCPVEQPTKELGRAGGSTGMAALRLCGSHLTCVTIVDLEQKAKGITDRLVRKAVSSDPSQVHRQVGAWIKNRQELGGSWNETQLKHPTEICTEVKEQLIEKSAGVVSSLAGGCNGAAGLAAAMSAVRAEHGQRLQSILGRGCCAPTCPCGVDGWHGLHLQSHKWQDIEVSPLPWMMSVNRQPCW